MTQKHDKNEGERLGESIFARNLEIRGKHFETWKYVFMPVVHRHLVAYFHPLFGFDTIQFGADWFTRLGFNDDEHEGVSLLESINERLGPYAVRMIYDLIDTPENEREPQFREFRFDIIKGKRDDDTSDKQGVLFDMREGLES